MKDSSLSRPNLVRLFAAVTGQALCVWFAVTYTKASLMRFDYEHGEEYSKLKSLPEYFVEYGNWHYLSPMFALSIGLCLIMRFARAEAVFEFVLSMTWLIGLGLALLCILAWQIQYVPIYSGMRWHY